MNCTDSSIITSSPSATPSVVGSSQCVYYLLCCDCSRVPLCQTVDLVAAILSGSMASSMRSRHSRLDRVVVLTPQALPHPTSTEDTVASLCSLMWDRLTSLVSSTTPPHSPVGSRKQSVERSDHQRVTPDVGCGAEPLPVDAHHAACPSPLHTSISSVVVILVSPGGPPPSCVLVPPPSIPRSTTITVLPCGWTLSSPLPPAAVARAPLLVALPAAQPSASCRQESPSAISLCCLDVVLAGMAALTFATDPVVSDSAVATLQGAASTRLCQFMREGHNKPNNRSPSPKSPRCNSDAGGVVATLQSIASRKDEHWKLRLEATDSWGRVSTVQLPPLHPRTRVAAIVALRIVQTSKAASSSAATLSFEAAAQCAVVCLKRCLGPSVSAGVLPAAELVGMFHGNGRSAPLSACIGSFCLVCESLSSTLACLDKVQCVGPCQRGGHNVVLILDAVPWTLLLLALWQITGQSYDGLSSGSIPLECSFLGLFGDRTGRLYDWACHLGLGSEAFPSNCQRLITPAEPSDLSSETCCSCRGRILPLDNIRNVYLDINDSMWESGHKASILQPFSAVKDASLPTISPHTLVHSSQQAGQCPHESPGDSVRSTKNTRNIDVLGMADSFAPHHALEASNVSVNGSNCSSIENRVKSIGLEESIPDEPLELDSIAQTFLSNLTPALRKPAKGEVYRTMLRPGSLRISHSPTPSYWRRSSRGSPRNSLEKGCTMNLHRKTQETRKMPPFKSISCSFAHSPRPRLSHSVCRIGDLVQLPGYLGNRTPSGSPRRIYRARRPPSMYRSRSCCPEVARAEVPPILAGLIAPHRSPLRRSVSLKRPHWSDDDTRTDALGDVGVPYGRKSDERREGSMRGLCCGPALMHDTPILPDSSYTPSLVPHPIDVGSADRHGALRRSIPAFSLDMTRSFANHSARNSSSSPLPSTARTTTNSVRLTPKTSQAQPEVESTPTPLVSRPRSHSVGCVGLFARNRTGHVPALIGHALSVFGDVLFPESSGDVHCTTAPPESPQAGTKCSGGVRDSISPGIAVAHRKPIIENILPSDLDPFASAQNLPLLSPDLPAKSSFPAAFTRPHKRKTRRLQDKVTSPPRRSTLANGKGTSTTNRVMVKPLAMTGSPTLVDSMLAAILGPNDYHVETALPGSPRSRAQPPTRRMSSAIL